MTMPAKDRILNNVLSQYAANNNMRENVRVYQDDLYIGNEIANSDQEQQIFDFIIKARKIA